MISKKLELILQSRVKSVRQSSVQSQSDGCQNKQMENLDPENELFKMNIRRVKLSVQNRRKSPK